MNQPTRHSRSFPVAAALCFALAIVTGSALAVETRLTVRVLAQDAKFIGSGMGGIAVTISDADSGEKLASGTISGGTGDTEKLMKTPRTRDMKLANQDSAGYTATLDLEEPTRVRIDVTGPMQPQSATQQASLTTWIAPGKDITGDGIIITLPGHAVAITALEHSDSQLAVSADVTMMCGCPFMEDGLWDASRLQVRAMLREQDDTLADFPLEFTGKPNHFSAAIQLDHAFDTPAQLFVYAWDPETGNTGAAKQMLKAQ